METVTIQVKGMSCEGCQAAVQKAIGSLEGVVSAQVDLQGGSAAVDFDDLLRLRCADRSELF